MTRPLLVFVLAPALVFAAPRWDFVVTVGDGNADVEWTLHGFPPGPLTLCPDREGVERFVALRLPRDPGDDTCWRALVPRHGPLTVRYRLALDAMARARGDPDYARRVDGGFLLCDEALLLRPDPLPDGATISVRFLLPRGWSAAAPWRRDGDRFLLDAAQYDAGLYIALGALRRLGEVPAGDGALVVNIFDRPRPASDDELRRWLGRYGNAVARLYGGLPGRRVHVHLAPVRGGAPGIFGATLRHRSPSVVILLGADAPPRSVESNDWVAPHELFHLGNPRLERRIPWFIEGFATYYEHVLRARTGASHWQMWGALQRGFYPYCDPGGTSLSQESRRLRDTHRYPRVYWGGACLAFRLDVAIRRRGKESLDSVLRALRRRGQDHPLTEEEIIAALDAAAGEPLAREHLDATTHIPLDPLYVELGIVPTRTFGPLSDDAPLAPLRRAIFAP